MPIQVTLYHNTVPTHEARRSFSTTTLFLHQADDIHAHISQTKMVSNSGALGFPRMGPNREMKFALEKHWRGKMDEASMLAIARDVEQQAWGIQMDAGVGLISAGDHCLYDNMLAW